MSAIAGVVLMLGGEIERRNRIIEDQADQLERYRALVADLRGAADAMRDGPPATTTNKGVEKGLRTILSDHGFGDGAR